MPDKAKCQVEVLTREEDFLSLEADWNRLWENGPRREIFTTFAWARACARTYGVNRLQIAIARRNGQVCAILPMIRQGGELRFVGAPHSDYNDLLCEADTGFAELCQLIDALAAAGAGHWRRMRYENLSERSRFYQILTKEDVQLKLPCSLRLGHSCPTVIAGDNAEQIFGDLIDKDNAKRCEKRMSRRGSLRCDHIESRPEVLALLATFFEQHRIRRGLATGSGGMFAVEENRLFFRNLVEAFDPAVTLRFAVLRLGDHPVAIHFGFEVDRRYTWYVPTFDVDQWNDYPGLVLLRRLFDYARGRKLAEFDFTIGDEEYKNRFANHILRNYELTVYPPGIGGQISLFRERLKRSVYSHRSTARMWTKARNIQRFIRKKGWIAGARHVLHMVFRDESILIFSCDSLEESSAPVIEAPLSHIVRHWLKHGEGTLPDTALARIRSGHTALSLQSENELAGLLWVAPPTADLTDIAPPPRPGYVAYDAWCAADVRADGLDRLLGHLAALAQRDATSAWVYCSQDDQALLDAAKRAGCQPAGRMRARTVLGQRHMEQPEMINESSSANRSPTLRRLQNLTRFFGKYGLRASFDHIAYRLTEHAYERYFDIETARVRELSEFGIEDGRLRECRPTHHMTIRKILRTLHVRPGVDVMVDIGAGSGRMVVRAGAYPFKKVVGVELVPEIAKVARDNIRRARRRMRCPDVDVVAGDATTFPIPPDTTVFFLNNPFSGEPLARVLENIKSSILQNPRQHTIVSVRPCAQGEGLIGKQPWLRKTRALMTLKGVPVFFYEIELGTAGPSPINDRSMALYRPFSPPPHPFRNVARTPTAVPVYTVRYRHPHHAGPSGYDRLCDYVGEVVELSRTMHALGETILRLPAKLTSWYGGSFEYSRQDFVMEMQAAVHMLRHKRSIYHFVYGEKSFKLLARLTGFHNHRFVASFHHPRSHYTWLFKHTDHLRRLDHAIVLSKNQLDLVAGLVGEGKVTFIPHGVDTDYYRPADKGAPPRSLRCVFVGDHERDFDALGGIIPAILDADKDVEFFMIACDTRCRSFERPPRARWYSFVSDKEYLGLLQSADLLVLPLRESTAVQGVLECMACGVPVVTTRGGVSDYLDDSCAVQCAQGDTQSMIDTALQLLRDDSRRLAMAAAARERALLFSWPRVAAKLAAVYEQVAATMPP